MIPYHNLKDWENMTSVGHLVSYIHYGKTVLFILSIVL
jgi:hypothetical protein